MFADEQKNKTFGPLQRFAGSEIYAFVLHLLCFMGANEDRINQSVNQ